MNWLRFYYHRLYSIPEDERAPDNIVPYDVLLDDWFDAEDSKRLRDKQKERRDGIGVKMNNG